AARRHSALVGGGSVCWRLLLLLDGTPLGVLLRDERFDVFGEQGMGVGGRGVGSGMAQVKILLVLERLAGGAVGIPELLILVEVQDAFENGDENAEPGGDQL